MDQLWQGASITVASTLLVDGFFITLTSTGAGATLSGGGARRIVHVTSGGSLTLDNVHLSTG